MNQIIKSKNTTKIKSYTLSDKEKIVLYAIINWPLSSDVNISKKINMKRSTYTAIKKRLNENKVYTYKYRLSTEYINEEILKCTSFEINPGINKDELDTFSKTVLESYSNSVYNIITDSFYIGFNFVKDFTKIKKGKFDFEQKWIRKKIFTKEPPQYVNFSMKHANVMVDYAPMIKHIFRLNIDEDNQTPDNPDKYKIKSRNIKLKKMNENEKKVISKLLCCPEKGDTILAKEINMNLQTFKKIKRIVIEKEIIKPIVIPILKRLENNFIIYTHFKFNQFKTIEERIDFIRYLDIKHPHHFIRIYDEEECITISVYKNYSTYHQNIKKIEEYIAKNKITSQKERNILIPIKNIKYLKNMVYLDLFKKIYDIKTDICPAYMDL